MKEILMADLLWDIWIHQSSQCLFYGSVIFFRLVLFKAFLKDIAVKLSLDFKIRK